VSILRLWNKCRWTDQCRCMQRNIRKITAFSVLSCACKAPPASQCPPLRPGPRRLARSSSCLCGPRRPHPVLIHPAHIRESTDPAARLVLPTRPFCGDGADERRRPDGRAAC
jgi:hypothetical protein